MRIHLAALYQETNSFSPLPTDLALFRRGKLLGGPEVIAEVRGSNLELAGMLEEAARLFPDAEPVTGLYAWGVASGPMTDDTFAELSARLLGPLRREGPFDAVLLSLHGSLGAETCEDCEGELLERVRAVVGPSVPIAVSFDFHAVISARILRHADVIVGYRTYPHVDMAATGRRTVAALAAWLTGGRRERAVARRWPAIVPVDNAQTESGPMAQLVAGIAALESGPGVLSASLFCAHPWFDTAGQGVTLVAYVEPAAAAAVGRRLEELLRAVWERRGEFLTDCPEPRKFFSRLAATPAPVAAIDSGDITTAGAPGDSTVFLRAAREAAGGPAVLLPLVDSATVSAAWEAGEGRSADFRPGGSDDAGAYNARQPLRAEVVRLADAPVRLGGAAFGGMTLDLGPRALLRAGPLHVLAMRHASWFHDPELWRSLGRDPAAADVIVQKSHKLFRPAYAAIARSVVTVETPGCTDRRLARLAFRRIPRPVFPLDPAATFAITTPL